MLPLLVCLLTVVISPVAGSSTGALACPAGEAAVGGAHLGGDVTRGPLEESAIGLQMLLDGQPLDPEQPHGFAIGMDHTLTLVAQEGTFKGFLVRLGSGDNETDTTEALSLDDNAAAKIASTVCVSNEEVGGLTHKDNLDKAEVAATLRVDELDGGMPLDVTVVVKNRDGESIYHYSRYLLSAVVEASSTTAENGSSSGSSGGSRFLANNNSFQALGALLLELLKIAIL